MDVKLDTVFPTGERVFFSALPLCYNESTLLSNTVPFERRVLFGGSHVTEQMKVN
jgi:hypothetical protein